MRSNKSCTVQNKLWINGNKTEQTESLTKGVHDDHSLLGNTSVRMHLLQDLVDVGRIRVGVRLALAGLLVVSALSLRCGLASLAGCLSWCLCLRNMVRFFFFFFFFFALKRTKEKENKRGEYANNAVAQNPTPLTFFFCQKKARRRKNTKNRNTEAKETRRTECTP